MKKFLVLWGIVFGLIVLALISAVGIVGPLSTLGAW